MPKKIFLLAFILAFFFFLTKIYIVYAESYATKQCYYYVGKIKNNRSKHFNISESISWGNIAIKKNPNSINAYECLEEAYIKSFKLSKRPISPEMLYYPVTLNNKVNMLIHERIRQDQNLKNKIIKEKKILQYKQNENIIMKIRDWLNLINNFIVKYKDLFIKSLIILVLGFLVRFLKKIVEKLKQFPEIYRKIIINYKNKSIAKLFNSQLNEMAKKFLKIYENKNDRCDTMIAWIKKNTPDFVLDIDYNYKDEIKLWIKKVNLIGTDNNLNNFIMNALEFTRVIYKYNYYFCKDLYDKLSNSINLTKEDWNKNKITGIDLVSLTLPSNADINKLKIEWNRRIVIYNDFLKDYNELVKKIQNAAEEKKVGLQLILIEDNCFPKLL
jgi:hypothetical protein